VLVGGTVAGQRLRNVVDGCTYHIPGPGFSNRWGLGSEGLAVRRAAIASGDASDR